MKEGESKMDYSKRSAEELCKRFGFDERGPGGIDLVVDCSGAEVCIQTGIFALRHGGTLVNVSRLVDSFLLIFLSSFRQFVLNRLAWERQKSTFLCTLFSSRNLTFVVVSGESRHARNRGSETELTLRLRQKLRIVTEQDATNSLSTSSLAVPSISNLSSLIGKLTLSANCDRTNRLQNRSIQLCLQRCETRFRSEQTREGTGWKTSHEGSHFRTNG
jgi:hypothetical protein